MIVIPLRKNRESNRSSSSSINRESGLCDDDVNLFRQDELDDTFVENSVGRHGNRLSRLGETRYLQGDEPSGLRASLDFFTLRRSLHAENSVEGDSTIEFLIAFVAFDNDNEAVGSMIQLLHRPAGCTTTSSCIKKGHGGLCLPILKNIRETVAEMVSHDDTSPSSRSSDFILRADGVFELKRNAKPESPESTPLYSPQKGRVYALAFSRYMDSGDPSKAGHQGFVWRTENRVWQVARTSAPKSASTHFPSKIYKSISERKVPTFFNDITVLALLVIQQGIAIDNLRTEFRRICSSKSTNVYDSARESREFTQKLLAFRNSTWSSTTTSLSPEMTDYLNDLQKSLRLQAAYQSIIDDSSYWSSHLELLFSAEQASSSEKIGRFLAILGILIAVGALWFQQGTLGAALFSIIPIVTAISFLISRRRQQPKSLRLSLR